MTIGHGLRAKLPLLVELVHACPSQARHGRTRNPLKATGVPTTAEDCKGHEVPQVPQGGQDDQEAGETRDFVIQM